MSPGVAATGAGTGVSHSTMDPAGPVARTIAEIGWVLFAGGAAIFVLVMALLWMAARHGGRDAKTSTWVIGGGIAFPVIVLSALLGYGTLRSAQLDQATPPDALIVAVTAKMWWWEVRYREPASGREIVLANEVRIPVGQPVHIGLTTSDVIHSFWVPALAGKIDMVPGRVNRLVFQADRPGVYRGQCAEFCGEAHAKMALHVVAEPREAFDAWLAGQTRPAAADSADPMLARGKAAFLRHDCGTCHTVRGLIEGARLGPDLTHVGSRLHLAAGTLPNHPGALAAWIGSVQRIKSGARMPSFDGIDAETLHALAAWLHQLR